MPTWGDDRTAGAAHATQPDALAGQRRSLATLALAATGGHQRQRFATDDHLFDDHLFDDVR